MHRFQPRNPGRPKGSRNKLGEDFIAALAADFAEHGKCVIQGGTGASRYRYLPTLDAPRGPGWDPKSIQRYREMFRVAGDYFFNQPGVQRVTARTRADKGNGWNRGC